MKYGVIAFIILGAVATVAAANLSFTFPCISGDFSSSLDSRAGNSGSAVGSKELFNYLDQRPKGATAILLTAEEDDKKDEDEEKDEKNEGDDKKEGDTGPDRIWGAAKLG